MVPIDENDKSSDKLKGLRTSSASNKKKSKRGIRYDLVGIIMGFALVSFCTSFYFNSTTGKKIQTLVPPTGHLIGPIQVTKANQVYEVSISQPGLQNREWRYVQAELLDENKQYLMSFGKELWHEEGYDSDGRWSEGEREYKMKLTLPKPGTYYLKVSSEADPTAAAAASYVILTKKRGSGLAHMVFGIILLISAVGTYFGTGGWKENFG